MVLYQSPLFLYAVFAAIAILVNIAAQMFVMAYPCFNGKSENIGE